MDRELLIEIGVEEIPASWLPGLTGQMATRLDARLRELRLPPAAAIESFSTPRRLTVRVGKLAERQTDFEELLTGPPVAAAFDASGQPTPAAIGFAKKNFVDVASLERLETPKGTYLSFRKQVRGKAAVDVLPDVMTGLLRELTFPKAMRWDACLDDGRGELPFGRPIRWILFLYGGRVVPFSIFRTPLAQGPLVQEIRSGAVTFGHRFLTTSGRAGRAIKVKGFDDYRKRLAENFVVLERTERQERIGRELEGEARRRGGRVSRQAGGQHLLQEVPDLVEYPKVLSGTFGEEFLSLPEEVLTTTMIHHQHFFPIVNDQGKLQPVFLAVLNMEGDKPELIARNLERVLTARLRDARFFYDADREQTLESRVNRLATVLFHKKLGSYAEKAARVSELAAVIARDVFQAPGAESHARIAGRLAKADLATDMVREMTELQGAMGGIYAREDGHPEEVWKAIYHQYLPIGVEADAPPSKEQLGVAATTWAAVALADKLDTVVGMFSAGERPTGSRDPYGLRRAAQGLVRILIDLPELTGIDRRVTLGDLVSIARGAFAQSAPGWEPPMYEFLLERVRYVLEQRRVDVRNVRAVTADAAADISPLQARRKAEVLPEFTESADFKQLAVLFKRVRNIAKNLTPPDGGGGDASVLVEPAEVALLREIEQRQPAIDAAVQSGQGFRQAFGEAAKLGPPVAKFFDDVLVMAEDATLRDARLRMMRRLERLIVQLADVSEIVAEETK
ncbi:MAG TPA: glycine--tRNA ligase subunit beta [Vicinamibacterales bacterium]|nr:glycine--tRNA ligase subunit beta [Vicinamibacterales bacterium]